jgi:hypothetical protein
LWWTSESLISAGLTIQDAHFRHMQMRL